MKPYRVAIIGTGDFAPIHVNALNAAGERVEIVAAMDINEAAVRVFCDKYHIPHWFTDSDKMLIIGFSGKNSIASEGSMPVAPEWINPAFLSGVFDS